MSHEHREFERVPADHPVHYRVPGSTVEGVGRIRDVSDTGIRFDADSEIPAGTAVSIRIEPVRAGAPTLLRPAAVVRCAPAESAAGYTVACAFD